MSKRKPILEARRVLSPDEQLTILADCQRILRDPERAGMLTHIVAMLRKTVTVPPTGPEVPSIPSVERAKRLGVGVVFTDDAPIAGEIRSRLYDHVFVYPVDQTAGRQWRLRFGRSLTAALDRFIGGSTELATHGEDEDGLVTA
ncbi:hypothetical protein K2X85_20630 [bacterium]|nr:hypothetical protein [bacterium]